MRILCVVLPPLPVFRCGKRSQGFLNILLCLLGWIPGVIHSWLVVSAHNAEIRRELQANRRQETAWEAAHTSPAAPPPPPGYVVASEPLPTGDEDLAPPTTPTSPVVPKETPPPGV